MVPVSDKTRGGAEISCTSTPSSIAKNVFETMDIVIYLDDLAVGGLRIYRDEVEWFNGLEMLFSGEELRRGKKSAPQDALSCALRSILRTANLLGF